MKECTRPQYLIDVFSSEIRGPFDAQQAILHRLATVEMMVMKDREHIKDTLNLDSIVSSEIRSLSAADLSNETTRSFIFKYGGTADRSEDEFSWAEKHSEWTDSIKTWDETGIINEASKNIELWLKEDVQFRAENGTE